MLKTNCIEMREGWANRGQGHWITPGKEREIWGGTIILQQF